MCALFFMSYFISSNIRFTSISEYMHYFSCHILSGRTWLTAIFFVIGYYNPILLVAGVVWHRCSIKRIFYYYHYYILVVDRLDLGCGVATTFSDAWISQTQTGERKWRELVSIGSSRKTLLLQENEDEWRYGRIVKERRNGRPSINGRIWRDVWMDEDS